MGDVVPVTYLHSDAVIKYLPALDVEPSQGWHTQCDIERQARLAWAEKLECVGASRRITSNKGASLTFISYGSSATVHGAVRGASFTVYVDGQAGNSSSSASNASAGILAELSNMSAGRHEIVLYVDSVDSNGQLDFSRVVFDAGLRSVGSNITQNAGKTYGKAGNGWSLINMQHLQMTYRDESGNDTNIVQESMSQGSDTEASSAQFTFSGTSVFVYGNLIDDHGRYQVKLDDDDPLLLTGKSSYSFYEGLLFFAGGLDPVAEHRLNFTNYDLKHFDVVYTVVRSDPISGDPSSVSSSTGHAPTSSEGASKGSSVQLAPIIGGAFGGAIAICAIIVVVLLVLRRRRHHLQTYYHGSSVAETTAEITSFRSTQEGSSVRSVALWSSGQPLHPPKRMVEMPAKRPPSYSEQMFY